MQKLAKGRFGFAKLIAPIFELYIRRAVPVNWVNAPSSVLYYKFPYKIGRAVAHRPRWVAKCTFGYRIAKIHLAQLIARMGGDAWGRSTKAAGYRDSIGELVGAPETTPRNIASPSMVIIVTHRRYGEGKSRPS